MFLSRLILNPGSREARQDIADAGQLHKTISHAFPELPPNSEFFNHYGILYRVDINQKTGVPNVLVQSNAKPDWKYLMEKDKYLLSPPDCKPVADQYASLHEGQMLAFRLRANVTKKIDTKTGEDGKRRHGRRIPLRTSEEQIKWLARKGKEGGFEILEVSTHKDVSYIRIMPERDIEFEKKNKTKEHKVTYGSVLFEGRLKIINSESFRQTLVNGMGSAKSFGFGLLSIAPA